MLSQAFLFFFLVRIKLGLTSSKAFGEWWLFILSNLTIDCINSLKCSLCVNRFNFYFSFFLYMVHNKNKNMKNKKKFKNKNQDLRKNPTFCLVFLFSVHTNANKKSTINSWIAFCTRKREKEVNPFSRQHILLDFDMSFVEKNSHVNPYAGARISLYMDVSAVL